MKRCKHIAQRFVVAIFIAVTTSSMSGNHSIGSSQGLSEDDKIIVMENGGYDNYQRFVIERKDSGEYHLYAHGQDGNQGVKVILDKEFEEGWPGMAGFVSPDKRFVYTVTDHMASVSGFPWKLSVFRTDVRTLETLLMATGPAMRVGVNGFTVASEPECMNPDVNSADMVYSYCDISYNFEGELMEKGQSYLDEELKKRYEERLINKNGVGVLSQ